MSAPVAAKAVKFTSAFRLAGMNYLEALAVQTNALRRVLKEPLRSESMGKTTFKYREFSYENAKELPPGELAAARRARRITAQMEPDFLRQSSPPLLSIAAEVANK